MKNIIFKIMNRKYFLPIARVIICLASYGLVDFILFKTGENVGREFFYTAIAFSAWTGGNK